MALTDTKLRNLKPKAARYEVADQGGMFAEVMPSGAIAFRYRYWLHGRKEKVTIGAYPETPLKRARGLHAQYRAMVEAGQSAAREKQAFKLAESSAETFKEFAETWLADNGHGDKWRTSQRWWLERDVFPAIGSRRIKDIGAADVLTLLDSIKKRGSPQSALRVRGIIKQVFDFAIGRQRATFNPAAQIPSRIVHKPQSRERSLSECEIRDFLADLESTRALRSNKLALRLLLLTMARKGELRAARWADVDFAAGEWRIPETKNGKPHTVYLSEQVAAIFAELKTMAGASEWVLPANSDPRKPMGESTLNAILYAIEVAKLRRKETVQSMTVHDLRRTASTLLHEQGFDSDVIEKALNHTLRGVRGVYNRAQYAEQRKAMLQHWADYIDAVERGATGIPIRRAIG